MKSIIEDFDSISSRLTEIEQEKHTAIMTAPVEVSAEQIASIYGIQWVDTAPEEYNGYQVSGQLSCHFDDPELYRCITDADGGILVPEDIANALRDWLGLSAIKI